MLWDNQYASQVPHAVDFVGSFWWKDILKLTPTYRGISHVVVHSGNTVLMWKDLWLDEVLAESHPRAFSYAKLEDILVRNFLGSQSLNETFHLPLSMQAHDELRHIQKSQHMLVTRLMKLRGISGAMPGDLTSTRPKVTTNFIFETCQLTKLTNGSGNLPPQ